VDERRQEYVNEKVLHRKNTPWAREKATPRMWEIERKLKLSKLWHALRGW